MFWKARKEKNQDNSVDIMTHSFQHFLSVTATSGPFGVNKLTGPHRAGEASDSWKHTTCVHKKLAPLKNI